LGPTPLADWTSSNMSRSSTSANPYSVWDSSRTTIEVASWVVSPRCRPAIVCGVHMIL
jgi:hypothetical protein